MTDHNKPTWQAPEHWLEQQQALKRVQLHFTFTAHARKRLQHDAIDVDLTPSNYIRKLIGLPYVKTTRPRIGLSFSEQDFVHLSQRYAIDPDNREALKRKVTEEINRRYPALD